MIQFYSPGIVETLTLPEQESIHCCRVLRMKEGDIIYVTDGKGHRYECVIAEPHPKHCIVEIISSQEIKPWWGFRMEICVAPSKNIDRMEWLVEKAVEIGVNRVVILRCARSERKTIRKDRLEKIAVSAMNQSLKTILPEVSEQVDFSKVIAEPFNGYKCLGYCDENLPRASFSKEYKGGDVRILIGPEGDFSPEEVRSAISHGYQAVTFGGSRLRLETAALYAAVASHVIGDVTAVS